MRETLNEQLNRIEKDLSDIKNTPEAKQVDYSADIERIEAKLLSIEKGMVQKSIDSKGITIEEVKKLITVDFISKLYRNK